MLTGFHHITLNVTDLSRSRAFYEGILGLRVDQDFPGEKLRLRIGETGRLVLRPPLPGTPPDDRFSERRIHLAIGVSSRAELDQLAEALRRNGVAADLHYDPLGPAIVSFRDPDNIQWELFEQSDELAGPGASGARQLGWRASMPVITCCQHRGLLPCIVIRLCEAVHMTGLTGKGLDGAQFDDVSLVGAEFRKVDLSRATFRNVDFTGVLIRGVYATSMDIDGLIENMTVNGIDVMPLVEAELDRRYPDRPKMRPTDAAGFREAWDVLERLWGQTVDRARGVDPDLLHERVNGEWSFIETLRHLVFATDAWVNRAILGRPSPWDPLGLPSDEMPDIPGVPRDLAARPSLSQVLALRADRMATVRRVLADLTDERLAATTDPVLAVGYPESKSFPVRRCLRAIINDEWEHRLFAERDLDALATRSALSLRVLR